MRDLLMRRVWRIGVETLWREGDRFFARLENRTYESEHEIPIESARRRYRVMRDGPSVASSWQVDTAPDPSKPSETPES